MMAEAYRRGRHRYNQKMDDYFFAASAGGRGAWAANAPLARNCSTS
jgi:hypothetical protein